MPPGYRLLCPGTTRTARTAASRTAPVRVRTPCQLLQHARLGADVVAGTAPQNIKPSRQVVFISFVRVFSVVVLRDFAHWFRFLLFLSLSMLVHHTRKTETRSRHWPASAVEIQARLLHTFSLTGSWISATIPATGTKQITCNKVHLTWCGVFQAACFGGLSWRCVLDRHCRVTA